MAGFSLVSIDPYKRTKIWYSAGFVVAAMGLLFITWTYIPTREQAMVLGALSIVFILVGAFLYLRAGKIHLQGEAWIDNEILKMEKAGEQTLHSLGDVSELRFTDNGMHRMNGVLGKILTLQFTDKSGQEIIRCQIFFHSEKHISEWLKPVKAAGIKTRF